MEPTSEHARGLAGLSLFVSHSNLDFKIVAWMAGQMRALGITPYLAEEDPRPSVRLADKVRSEIERADAVLVLLTSNGVASNYVQQEIGAAIYANKPVLAFAEIGVELGNLGMLTGVEYVVFDPNNLGESSAQVTRALAHFNRSASDDVPQRIVVASQPVLQLQMSAELQLTGGQLLLGLFLLTAAVGVLYLASQPDAFGTTA